MIDQKMRRIFDNIYYNIYTENHYILLGDRFYKWCYVNKRPVDDSPVNQRKVIKEVKKEKTKKVEARNELSEDQVKKPVAPGLVDDAYVAFTSGGG